MTGKIPGTRTHHPVTCATLSFVQQSQVIILGTRKHYRVRCDPWFRPESNKSEMVFLSGLDEPFASFRAVGVGLGGVARGHNRVGSTESGGAHRSWKGLPPICT